MSGAILQSGRTVKKTIAILVFVFRFASLRYRVYVVAGVSIVSWRISRSS